MFSSIYFWLATAAIVIIIVCYFLILVKLKPANETSEPSKLLQENNENLSVQRRMEMLEKIKEERIKEYLDKRKRKLGSS